MLYEIICCMLCVFAVYGIYCAAREVYFLLMTHGGRSEDGDNGPDCGHNCITCRGCTLSCGENLSDKSSEESQPHNVSEENASKD